MKKADKKLLDRLLDKPRQVFQPKTQQNGAIALMLDGSLFGVYRTEDEMQEAISQHMQANGWDNFAFASEGWGA